MPDHRIDRRTFLKGVAAATAATAATILPRAFAEQTDVAAANPKIVDRIRQIMGTAHTPSDYPHWNFVP